MEYIINGSDPKIGLLSGMHGDEWKIIASVTQALKKFQTKMPDYLYVPECSPSAVRQRQRLNKDGIDINRDFFEHPVTQEVKDITTLLKPYSFKLCVDFHEDMEIPGVYIYDSYNIEGSETLSAFREQVIPLAPLHTGIDDAMDKILGCHFFQGYHACSLPEKTNGGDFVYSGSFDCWATIEGRAKRCITLDVPTNLSETQKNKIIDIFFRSFII